ncbi:TonB-dependent receptor [bacterium]|nr:TonB-dependent receptor [bacterium]
MTINTNSRLAGVLLAGVATSVLPAWGQQATPETGETVVVIGSYIEGVADSGALPVTVISREELEATGALSTGELLANIPSLGDAQFTDNNTGTNGARGDVTGANLRGLGTGRTLTLVNGRRIAGHPQSEAVDSVPETFTNVNAVPSSLINRVEVLRDGASALYGSDAIAGVVNMTLFNEGDGKELSLRASEGDELPYKEIAINGRLGFDFNDGRTNFTFGGNYYERQNVDTIDYPEWYRTSDRRNLLPADWLGDTQFDNGSSLSPYARLRSGTLLPDGRFQGIRVSRTTPAPTVNYTSASGFGSTAAGYHIQPTGFPGSLATLRPGVSLDDTSTLDRDLNYDFSEDETVIPAVTRLNVGLTFTHELMNGVELFGEGLFYSSHSETKRAAGPIDTSLAFLVVPAQNYYNPFGPTGSVNRLPGINAPAAGLSSVIVGYRPVELGPRRIEVEQALSRVLGGLRFEAGAWDVESAIGWSVATATDEEFNRLSKTLLQNQLALSTPDAFNPFGGPFANSEDVLSKVRVSSVRYGESSLLTWDAKAVNSNLFMLPGGPVGVAVGSDFRREKIIEDSDPRLDGTLQFTNGAERDRSDLVGVSATNDFTGDRDVWSAFAEVNAPIVGEGNNFPLMYALDLQLAGRFESSSDFGDNFSPKAALHWFVAPSLSIRAAYGEGFRAPNLVQINQGDITRRNQGDVDPYRVGVTNTPGDLGETYRTSLRAGNPDLEAEESESRVLGIVFEPGYSLLDGLRLSVDYFEVETTNAIANIGVDRLLEEDFNNRVAGGAGIPEVIRAPITPDELLLFNAFNAANPTMQRPAAGEVINVLDGYVNLDRRQVSGYDIAVSYAFPPSAIGDVSIGTSGTNILELLEIQQDGTSFDNIRFNGNPEWRANLFFNWSRGPWRSGWSARYVSDVEDSSATNDVTGARWQVDSWYTVNGFVSYTFDPDRGSLGGTELKLGVRNLTNELPPFADETYGFINGLYDIAGRVVYGEIKKVF